MMFREVNARIQIDEWDPLKAIEDRLPASDHKFDSCKFARRYPYLAKLLSGRISELLTPVVTPI